MNRPSQVPLGAAAALLLVLFLSLRAVYRLFLHPLRQFPGPASRAVSHIPHARSILHGHLPQDLTSLHAKYGDVAVLDETLRTHHPTPIALPRLVPPAGLQVDGQWIPGNTVMGMAMQTAQTSARNWVAPREFHPERHLPPGHALRDSRFDQDDREAFKPFSIGTRNCPGGKVFLAEARVLLARTFWSFELALTPDTPADWMDQKAYLVFEPKPVRVRLSEKAWTARKA